MTEQRAVSSSLSADVINLLQKRGMTLEPIAKATGTTKSFMSRVKSRARSLTINAPAAGPRTTKKRRSRKTAA